MYRSDDAQYRKKVDSAFNGIVRLASHLQKAQETGRSNYVEMSEVSRYLAHHLKTQIEDSVRYIDHMKSNRRDDGDFGRLRTVLLRTFDEVTRVASKGYEKLISSNGSVNQKMLEELIHIDGEITSCLMQIRNALISANNNGGPTAEELREIESIAGELSKNASERTALIR